MHATAEHGIDLHHHAAHRGDIRTGRQWYAVHDGSEPDGSRHVHGVVLAGGPGPVLHPDAADHVPDGVEQQDLNAVLNRWGDLACA